MIPIWCQKIKFFNVVFVLIYLDGVSCITKWYQYNVKISKFFNVIFVLIYLDGILSLWKKALFRGKGALFRVVHLNIFGTISRWHYSGWHYWRYYCIEKFHYYKIVYSQISSNSICLWVVLKNPNPNKRLLLLKWAWTHFNFYDFLSSIFVSKIEKTSYPFLNLSMPCS